MSKSLLTSESVAYMLITWTNEAENTLNEILDYFISIQERETGEQIVVSLVQSVARLSNFPLSGRMGRIEDTREVIPRDLPYIVVYKLVAIDRIAIINVFHTSQSRDIC